MATLATIDRRSLTACTLLMLGTAACDNSNSPTSPEFGYVTVLVEVSGGDPDDTFEIQADSIVGPALSNASSTLRVVEGIHFVELKGVAPNCIVEGTNRVSVNVAADDTVEVAFKVGCAETGIRIETRTTGQEIPASFDLVIPSIPQSSIGTNGARSITRLTAGTYALTLKMGVINCRVTGDSTVSVPVINREISNVTFNVFCSEIPRFGVVAFVSTGRIFVMSGVASNSQFVADGAQPGWSRDGERIVYATTLCDYYYYFCAGGLQMINPSAGQVTSLPTAKNGVDPDWSPVEDVIAYVDVTTGSLHLLTVATEATVKVDVPGVTRITHPSWSPDGTRLVAACQSETGPSRLCIFNRDGSGLKFITEGGTYDTYPAWSPDGNKISFARYGNSPFPQVMVMNADGAAVRSIGPGLTSTWSPDSRHLMFTGINGLFLVNADGTSLTAVTSGTHYSPAWRP